MNIIVQWHALILFEISTVKSGLYLASVQRYLTQKVENGGIEFEFVSTNHTIVYLVLFRSQCSESLNQRRMRVVVCRIKLVCHGKAKIIFV